MGDVELKKSLNLFNGIGIIVGSVIGSGIFVSPTGVYLQVGSSGGAIIIWFLCGMFSMIGAYCYVELGVLIKRSSGDYAYIMEAYGPFLAFFRMWVDVIVNRPCSIAVVALTFAEYTLEPMYLGCKAPILARQLLAAMCIMLLAFINCISVKAATKVQDIFTVAKLLALVIIILTGIVKLCMGYTVNWDYAFTDTSSNVGQWTMAFYTGLFAYSGWNNLNIMIGEMAKPKRDLPIAIFISCTLITVVYVMTNVAYFTILSPVEIRTTNAVAVKIGINHFSFMWWIIPLFVAMSTFGGINGGMMTTSRIFVVAAQWDHMPLSLAMLSRKYCTPIPSVIFVAVISMVYLIYPDMFVLINYVGFVTWFTIAMAVSTILYFRYYKNRFSHLDQSFQVNLVFPIIYLAVSLFIIVFAFVGGFYEALMGTFIMLTAIPVYLICVVWKKPMMFQRKLNNFTITIQKLLSVEFSGSDKSD